MGDTFIEGRLDPVEVSQPKVRSSVGKAEIWYSQTAWSSESPLTSLGFSCLSYKTRELEWWFLRTSWVWLNDSMIVLHLEVYSKYTIRKIYMSSMTIDASLYVYKTHMQVCVWVYMYIKHSLHIYTHTHSLGETLQKAILDLLSYKLQWPSMGGDFIPLKH